MGEHASADLYKVDKELGQDKVPFQKRKTVGLEGRWERVFTGLQPASLSPGGEERAVACRFVVVFFHHECGCRSTLCP
ncbi:hypothetical protein [Streptomyces sp. RT42]|uniref:hypothetical protein n=1 Tax=Streptomyces sp. RT42 TaxID=2824898 RepID=UPI001B370CE4|nr:hypothetical protein [Streptomyces sp. RT42]MBQ0877554.1 hypothetical protein [Streptomyces sp. RT42]